MANIRKIRAILFTPKLLSLFILLPFLAFILWVVYLDFTIRSTFEGKKWSVPSTVYARPLEIFPGAKLSIKDFKSELTMLGYQFVNKVERAGQAKLLNNRIIVHTHGFQFSDVVEPPQHIEVHFTNGEVTQLISKQQHAIIRIEPVVIGGIYPAHKEDRLLVKHDQIPASLLAMLVAVEDDNFYGHYGISLRGIARAIVANIRGGGFSQGASTLTQQLVKNYYLSADKTLSRKAQEAIMALLLELHVSKQEILEGYSNEVYLGQDGPRAIHGFGLASQYYFRQPLHSLSIQQQALLVTLVRGASYYNPWRHPQRVKNRRDMVLDIAVREGKLSAESATFAKQQPLGLGDQKISKRKRYPAYLDVVRRQLKADYNVEDLASNGLSIFTHFDPLVQLSSEKSLTTLINTKKQITNLQGAVVVTRPNTGAVIAIVGGSDARYAGFNRAIDTQRAVGSLIKPAVFLTALNQQDKYNLATLVNDDEYSVKLSNTETWTPQNYDKQHHGEVLLYKALANSYNVSTARLGNELGLDKVINTIHQLGAEQDIAPLPSLTLGAVAMSPFNIAQMYQTVAAEGFYTPLQVIDSVVDPGGNTLSRYALAIDQRYSSESIYLLRHALQAVTHEGTAKALTWLLPDFSVAGKTGTTNDLRDSWFAGFSGDMLAVVWLGKDDNSNIGLTGSSGALRVWADLMAQRSTLEIQNIPPEGIDFHWVDKETGMGSQESCANSIPLPFIKGTAPEIENRCDSGVKKVFDWFRGVLD